MGAKSRRKGGRIEREIVHRHEELGITCRRRQAAGHARGHDDPDLLIGDALVAEVKARASGGGFKTMERWLGDDDLLFLRRDNADPLVLMPWAVYARLITCWHNRHAVSVEVEVL